MTGTSRGDADANRLAMQSLAVGDPTGWFDRLYAEAADGTAVVPWDSGAPNVMLVEWFATRPPAVAGRALVVGCGLGRDAEYLTSRGLATTAFDISPTAVAGARERFPDTQVDFRVADLLALPPDWVGAFDLVVESYTVQALPVALHASATDAVTTLVAPGGTLLVLAAVGSPDVVVSGPPWPLVPAEIDRFADGPLAEVSREELDGANGRRWRVTFERAS